jgi:hypothetical protein
MADATLRDLSADTDIGTTDVMPKQAHAEALKKITGSNIKASLESGGGIALSLSSVEVSAAGADTRVQYNNGTARGGDADLVWDDSGKALTVGASTVTATTVLPQNNNTGSPTLAFGDGDSGLLEQGDDVLRISCGGTGALTIGTDRMYAFGDGAFRGGLINENSSSTNPTLCPKADDQDTGVGSVVDVLSVVSGGVRMFSATESTTDAVRILTLPLPAAMGTMVRLWVPTSFMTMVLDESNNELEFWVKYADGTTIKSGVVALA